MVGDIALFVALAMADTFAVAVRHSPHRRHRAPGFAYSWRVAAESIIKLIGVRGRSELFLTFVMFKGRGRCSARAIVDADTAAGASRTVAGVEHAHHHGRCRSSAGSVVAAPVSVTQSWNTTAEAEIHRAVLRLFSALLVYLTCVVIYRSPSRV